jgi:glycosyltransferase involved in cell wall biosynthesis
VRIAYVLADSGVPVFGAKGASIHVREMVNALAALGHEVTLIVALYGQPRGTVAAHLVKITIGDEGEVPTALKLEAEERRRLRETLAMAIAAAAEAMLLRFHEEEGFDLIYERYSLFSAAAVRTARSLGVPCCVEVNAPLVQEQRRFRRLAHVAEAEAVEAEVFAGADALLAVSDEVRAYALAKGAEAARTHVMPNGVDVARFHPEVPVAPPDGLAGKFVVGFSGSLKPWHGVEMLMDAFRLLARRSPDYHLLIVGDGPLRDWIHGYLRGAELEAAVTCTGWVGHEQLPGLLRAMEVAVAPYPAMESFYFSPLKLYEYMAVGVPVIASGMGQIARIIRHEETGLLVEPGDPGALADQIERLRTDPVLRARIGAKAARHAGEFTWAGNARQVIDLARKLSRSAATPGSA